MRTLPIFAVCAVAAFIGFYFLAPGVYDRVSEEPESEAIDGKKKNTGQAAFPDELSPIIFGKSAPKAAKWKRSKAVPVCAVLAKWTGKLHRWHEYLDEDWRSYSVEQTELVLVVSKQRPKLIQTVQFSTPANAPPVKRYRHDVDVYLVEAKTGKTIAAKTLVRIARPVNGTEPWALTELGKPVSWKTVNRWLQYEIADKRQSSVASAQ